MQNTKCEWIRDWYDYFPVVGFDKIGEKKELKTTQSTGR
jgi:hypothetical protein